MKKPIFSPLLRLLRTAAAASVIAGIVGCGYTLQGSSSVLPPDVKKIYIPYVENNSTETGLSSVVTEAIRDQFERYASVTLVDSLEDADAVLKAKILKVEQDTSTVTSKTDTALTESVKLVLSAELERVTGPLLWKDENITVSRQYASTQNVVSTSSPEFVSGTLSSSDLSGLDSREVSRFETKQALAFLAGNAAQTIYNEAIAPDF